MRALVALVIAVLLAVPVVQAQSNGVNIVYGRSWPESLVVDSARGIIYIDASSGDYPPTGFSFGVINASAEAVTRVVGLPVFPGELALDESTGTVYVGGNNSIAVFDGKTQSFVRTIPLRVPVFGLACDNATGDVLFTSGNGVYQLNPATGKILTSVTTGTDAEDIALDYSNGEVFVSNYLSASISVLRSSDLSPIKTVQLPKPSYPSELALDARNNLLYATTDENSILVIDATSNSIVTSLALPGSNANGTYAVAVDDHSNRVFAVAEPGTTITELDGASGAIAAQFRVISAVFDLAVDQRTGELYVSNYHQVTVFTPPYTPINNLDLPVAALVLVATAVVVAILLYFRRVTASGGMRGGPPSPPQTPLAS